MLFSLVICLLFLPSSCYAISWLPSSLHERVEWVYRGDSRNPDQIKASGGFLPPKNPPPPQGFSLDSHIRGDTDAKGVKQTAYVSTSVNEKVAKSFSARTYVYKIHATPNFIDVAASLKKDYPAKREREMAALSGIHWDQVHSWARVPDVGSAGKGRAKKLTYTPNPDYDTRYEKYAASGAHPQLAGFPPYSPKWLEKKWRPFTPSKGRTAADYAKALMNAIGHAVRWKSEFSLFKPSHKSTMGREATPDSLGTASPVKNGVSGSGDSQKPTAGARRADKAVKSADESVRNAMKEFRANPTFDQSRFDEAWAKYTKARISVANAVVEASMTLVDKYKSQAMAEREATSTKLLPDLDAAARRAEVATSGAKRVAVAAAARLDEKKTALDDLKKLLQDKDVNGDMLRRNGIVWFSGKESKHTAIQREIVVREEEVKILNKGAEHTKAAFNEANAQVYELRKPRIEAIRQLAELSKEQDKSKKPWRASKPKSKKGPEYKKTDGKEPAEAQGPSSGPRGPLHGPRGPITGPQGPVSGPKGSKSSQRGPSDSPRGSSPAFSRVPSSTRPRNHMWRNHINSKAGVGARPIGMGRGPRTKREAEYLKREAPKDAAHDQQPSDSPSPSWGARAKASISTALKTFATSALESARTRLGSAEKAIKKPEADELVKQVLVDAALDTVRRMPEGYTAKDKPVLGKDLAHIMTSLMDGVRKAWREGGKETALKTARVMIEAILAGQEEQVPKY
ncbi:putative enterotoxin [Ophiocordyceps australis]|uniref:Putative enterotoxin n=1 Tax=Ophiocordyceps australis TaxID=1399860 RepID=A0A2C5Y0U4_9HYPO|nr:putative enterotoxin [Ophiocordyceps australis]